MAESETPITDTPTPEAPAQEEWKLDKSGKQYTSRGDSNWPLYRQGNETVEQARARYQASKSEKAKPKDKRPRKKTPTPKKQEAPKGIDLQQLEHELVEILRAPAIPAALYGDTYLSDHFTKTGPYLARNLVVASEHNPWLRKKLEELASGETFIMGIMSMVPVVSGVLLYSVPPVVYLLNLQVPEVTRSKFGIPERKATNAHPDASPPPIFTPTPPGPETA